VSVIAYTAIYGGYDPLHSHIDHPDVAEWICYTDDPELIHPDWTVIVEPARYAHPRLSAKWRKTHPPLLTDRSIWLDGSVQPISPRFVTGFLDLLDAGADMAMFRHPQRDNIFDEVAYSAGMRKYEGLPMAAQAAGYAARRSDARELGLWASTTFAREHRPHVLQMGAAWQAHCELATYQDQLSLPVLIADYGVHVLPVDADLLKNDWFVWHWGKHASFD
jgi:hypothetical protein